MAILKNSILGQISGKLGGMIFRSNQFGTHIYTAPNAINKNSDAQNLVRATLGAPTQKFTDLGISDRQAWNQFAANSFSNCRKKGAPSKKGYLVYKSCITTRQLMNLYFHDFNVYLSDGYSHLPAIVTNLGYPSTAPIAMISPFIISNSSQGTKTYFQNCVLSRAGLSSFFINFLNLVPSSYSNEFLISKNKERFGFAFYSTAPELKQPKLSNNFFKSLIAWTGFISFSGYSGFIPDTMRLETQLKWTYTKKFNWGKLNEWFRISCLLISEKGTCCNIGHVDVPLTP